MIIDSIDVGSVDFGNTESLNKNVIINTNPNDGVFIFRDSNWPSNDIRSYKISVNKTVLDALVESILDNIGKEIEITDQYLREYKAILLRPDVIMTTIRDRSPGCHSYELELQFLILEESQLVGDLGNWDFSDDLNSNQVALMWD